MKELKTQFEGRGEVKGYLFTLIEKMPNSYLYEVKNEENGKCHYEVFRRTINTQFDCVSYPKSKSFGIWAWTYKELEESRIKQRIIEQNEIEKQKL